MEEVHPESSIWKNGRVSSIFSGRNLGAERLLAGLPPRQLEGLGFFLLGLIWAKKGRTFSGAGPRRFLSHWQHRSKKKKLMNCPAPK